jgi:predicted Fe-Mo cluster-binding NifX family protein
MEREVLRMKAAFAVWKDRIAPVFDVTHTVRLVETDGKQIISQTQAVLAGDLANQKALRLAELEVNTLVCGAISKSLQSMVAAYGIQVIAFVTGDLQEIIQAWIRGKLEGAAQFAMPGCRRSVTGRVHGAYVSKQRSRQ